MVTTRITFPMRIELRTSCSVLRFIIMIVLKSSMCTGYKKDVVQDYLTFLVMIVGKGCPGCNISPRSAVGLKLRCAKQNIRGPHDAKLNIVDEDFDISWALQTHLFADDLQQRKRTRKAEFRSLTDRFTDGTRRSKLRKKIDIFPSFFCGKIWGKYRRRCWQDMQVLLRR